MRSAIWWSSRTGCHKPRVPAWRVTSHAASTGIILSSPAINGSRSPFLALWRSPRSHRSARPAPDRPVGHDPWCPWRPVETRPRAHATSGVRASRTTMRPERRPGRWRPAAVHEVSLSRNSSTSVSCGPWADRTTGSGRHASSIPEAALQQAFRMLTLGGSMSGGAPGGQPFDIRLRCGCGFDGLLDTTT